MINNKLFSSKGRLPPAAFLFSTYRVLLLLTTEVFAVVCRGAVNHAQNPLG